MHLKYIALPIVAVLTVLLTVGCNNNNMNETEKNTSKIESSSEATNVSKKELEEKRITSSVMYDLYLNIAGNIDTLSVEDIEKLLEGFIGDSLLLSHSDSGFQEDSEETLLNELTGYCENENMTLSVSYLGYDHDGNKISLDKAEPLTVSLEVSDKCIFDFVKSEGSVGEYSVRLKDDSVIELAEELREDRSIEDTFLKIAKALTESEDITIDEIQERLDTTFDEDATGEITLTPSDDPAITKPISVKYYNSLINENGTLNIGVVNNKIYTVSCSTMSMVEIASDDVPQINYEVISYSYVNRRAFEPERVEALQPDYKPELTVSKDVKSSGDQIKLYLNHL